MHLKALYKHDMVASILLGLRGKQICQKLLHAVASTSDKRISVYSYIFHIYVLNINVKEGLHSQSTDMC